MSATREANNAENGIQQPTYGACSIPLKKIAPRIFDAGMVSIPVINRKNENYATL